MICNPTFALGEGSLSFTCAFRPLQLFHQTSLHRPVQYTLRHLSHRSSWFLLHLHRASQYEKSTVWADCNRRSNVVRFFSHSATRSDRDKGTRQAQQQFEILAYTMEPRVGFKILLQIEWD